MQDAIAEFLRAPIWAQIAMVAAALFLITSVTGSFFAKRRFRGRFTAIAQALGAPVPNGSGWPVTFPITIEDRAFEVKHALMHTSKNSPHRGPRGHLLITATRLNGDRWPLHQVDISMMGKLVSRITGGMPCGVDGRRLQVFVLSRPWPFSWRVPRHVIRSRFSLSLIMLEDLSAKS